MENKQVKTNNKVDKRNWVSLSDAQRFDVSEKNGLTAEQVEQRKSEGLFNADTTKRGKTVAQIIFSNLFTFFNIIYILATVLYVVMAFVCKDVTVFVNGKEQSAFSYIISQLVFLPTVIANTLIAIVQELRSKKTLDKLNLITEPQIEVLRDGNKLAINVSELVLDDIVIIKNGAQISADCIVLDDSVEVNESILTGESEAVTKKKGDTLYAGSFVVSGSCTAKVDKVGKYNYIAGLTDKAKKYQKPRSQMLNALRIILIFVAVIIVPMTVGLAITTLRTSTALVDGFVSEGIYLNDGTNQMRVLVHTLVPTASTIISMIPAGPFLLTSVALAVSVMRLAKNKTMVQELYCIEMLARVDTLCLDKTGTITDGTMNVVETIDLRAQPTSLTIREIVSSMNTALKADNMTSRALKKYFGAPKKTALSPVTVVPFSSERKLSAVSFQGEGTYIIGAPEFVLKAHNERVNDLVKKYAEQGLRVLLLAHSTTSIFSGNTLPTVRRPIAVIVIEDHLRPEAEETINWFKNSGVAIKIISGDNPMAVSSIATRVGVENADKFISLEGMSEEDVAKIATEYTVFGRVSPEQKAILVRALKKAGKTVAMTGDGVNDILAMKESDCSISLAGGSDAARKVSHLVLLDDNFSALPKVVAEGRRVVNNIQSSTSMYFMKTIYMLVINSVLIACELSGVSLVVPFNSMRVLLLDTVIVGLPTTLLALQPNEHIIEGNFLGNVLKRCLPASITFILETLSLYAIWYFSPDFVGLSNDQLSSLIILTYTFGGFFALFYACKPFNKWKTAMYVCIGIVVMVGVIWFADLLQFAVLTREQLFLLIAEVLATPYILFVNMRLFQGRTPKFKRLKTNN